MACVFILVFAAAGRSFLFTTKRNEPKKRSPKSQELIHFRARAKLAMLRQRAYLSENELITSGIMRGKSKAQTACRKF